MHFTEAEKLCRIRDGLSSRIGISRYRTWFGDATGFCLADDLLQVSVPNAFVQSWIASNYLTDLREVACFACECEMRVSVTVAEKNGSQSPAAPSKTTPAARNEPLLAALPPQNPTSTGQSSASGNGFSPPLAAHASRQPFNGAPLPAQAAKDGHNGAHAKNRPGLRGDLDSFVVGSSNELAYTSAMRLIQAPGAAFKSLFIHGNCGLGKTHLLQGICNALRRTHPTLEWCYISGEEFTNEFVHAVKATQIDRFRARFRKVDVLAIDDVHFLANKKATQEEFLHTFNAIDASGKAVVMSSDRPPREIAELSEALLSRLLAGLVTPIAIPDFETRREILRRRLLTMPCRVPDDALEFVAHHISGNVRELEGALFKLAAVGSLSKEPITLALTRAALNDHIVRSVAPQPALTIEQAVAERLGVSRDLIHSNTRDTTASLARALVIFLCRKHAQMSYPEIGRRMGNKNHSTVLMASRRIEQMLETDERISWRSAAGMQEAPLRDVLMGLDQALQRRAASSA